MRRAPLAGLVVALTRPEGSTDSLRRRLEALGATVLLAPAIRRAPPRSARDLDRAARALREGAYAAVAFTSPASVDALLARRPSPRRALSRVIVAAVGPATSAALRSRGITPTVTGREGGAALARPLLRALRSVPGPVLLPRAEGGREELPRALATAGIDVDVVPAYRTVPARRADLASLDRELRDGGVHAIVVASPSAVESLARSCPHVGRAPLVAIGATTAGAARERGLRVVVAARPDEVSLVRAARRALGR